MVGFKCPPLNWGSSTSSRNFELVFACDESSNESSSQRKQKRSRLHKQILRYKRPQLVRLILESSRSRCGVKFKPRRHHSIFILKFQPLLSNWVGLTLVMTRSEFQNLKILYLRVKTSGCTSSGSHLLVRAMAPSISNIFSQFKRDIFTTPLDLIIPRVKCFKIRNF